jgi:hypothetical protein
VSRGSSEAAAKTAGKRIDEKGDKAGIAPRLAANFQLS